MRGEGPLLGSVLRLQRGRSKARSRETVGAFSKGIAAPCINTVFGLATVIDAGISTSGSVPQPVNSVFNIE